MKEIHQFDSSLPSAHHKAVIQLDGPYVQYQHKKMLDFSSEDFLGLAQHPDVKKGSIKQILRLGIGAPPNYLSALAQNQLEEKMAQFIGMQRCHLFSSYLAAKFHLFKHFPGDDLAVFSDVDSTLPLESTSFENTNELEKLLKLSKKPWKLIYIQSDLFDVDALAQIAKKEEALLCLDDTYSFGLLGNRGLGLSSHKKQADIIISSLHRAGGCPVAYLASSSPTFRQYPQFPALSPALLGGLDCILNMIVDMKQEREQVEHHTVWLQKKLKERGFENLLSRYPTQMLTFAAESDATRLWDILDASDIFAGRPSALQISFNMTALHTPDDLDQLAVALKKVSAADFALRTQSLTPTPVM